MGSVGASQRSASLFEQLRERESTWIGQLSFSLSTKVFLLESQVVKPEERCGFFVRGGATLPGGGGGIGQAALNQALAPMHKSGHISPSPQIGLASLCLSRGRVVLFWILGGERVEQQVGGLAVAHTHHHHQLLPGLPAAGN